MFLTSFDVHFVFGYACFMYICIKTAIWLFSGLLWDKVWLILVKTGWQPCQKGPALCFVCACGERPKHFVEDMMNLMLLFS